MAEIVLTAHLLVILFFVVGFPAGLIINHAGFRYFHCGALALVTLLMILKIPCPLTIFEEILRGESYSGSFIATWLNRIVYFAWFTPKTVFIIDLCFALLVLTSFYWRPVKRKTKVFHLDQRRKKE